MREWPLGPNVSGSAASGSTGPVRFATRKVIFSWPAVPRGGAAGTPGSAGTAPDAGTFFSSDGSYGGVSQPLSAYPSRTPTRNGTGVEDSTVNSSLFGTGGGSCGCRGG